MRVGREPNPTCRCGTAMGFWLQRVLLGQWSQVRFVVGKNKQRPRWGTHHSVNEHNIHDARLLLYTLA